MTEEALANEELEQPEPGAEVELEEPNLEAVQEVEEDAARLNNVIKQIEIDWQVIKD